MTVSRAGFRGGGAWAIDIADLTLDEVVRHLIAGDALHISGGVEFSLPLPDSRTVLAFYNQKSPSLLEPGRKTPTSWTGRLIGCSSRSTNRSQQPRRQCGRPLRTNAGNWVGVTAHRFRGLHRHCDEAAVIRSPSHWIFRAMRHCFGVSMEQGKHR